MCVHFGRFSHKGEVRRELSSHVALHRPLLNHRSRGIRRRNSRRHHVSEVRGVSLSGSSCGGTLQPSSTTVTPTTRYRKDTC